PAFDNSAMDGYAISGDDHASWLVVHRIAAGDAGAHVVLEPGQAARIFTGAPIPAGTTSVVMQEHVDLDADSKTIRLNEAAAARGGTRARQSFRRKAAVVRAVASLSPLDWPLPPVAVGLLAGQGYTHASCVLHLRVTVCSRGNEPVEPGEQLRA